MMTSLQFCVNVMVRLTIVILKNVAVASSGKIMTSVIPDDIITLTGMRTPEISEFSSKT
jgi:hypothetical protein